jgi:hypothetical protein
VPPGDPALAAPWRSRAMPRCAQTQVRARRRPIQRRGHDRWRIGRLCRGSCGRGFSRLVNPFIKLRQKFS